MLKILKNHNIYEIFNEWEGSVAILQKDSKPTVDDIHEVFLREKWYLLWEENPSHWGNKEQFIKKYVSVSKLKIYEQIKNN